MPITFRPDKRHNELLDELKERNERSKFINQAIDFYVSIQPIMELLQELANGQQTLSSEVKLLNNKLNELVTGRVVLKGINKEIEQLNTSKETKSEDQEFVSYLFSGVTDISD